MVRRPAGTYPAGTASDVQFMSPSSIGTRAAVDRVIDTRRQFNPRDFVPDSGAQMPMRKAMLPDSVPGYRVPYVVDDRAPVIGSSRAMEAINIDVAQGYGTRDVPNYLMRDGNLARDQPSIISATQSEPRTISYSPGRVYESDVSDVPGMFRTGLIQSGVGGAGSDRTGQTNYYDAVDRSSFYSGMAPQHTYQPQQRIETVRLGGYNPQAIVDADRMGRIRARYQNQQDQLVAMKNPTADFIVKARPAAQEYQLAATSTKPTDLPLPVNVNETRIVDPNLFNLSGIPKRDEVTGAVVGTPKPMALKANQYGGAAETFVKDTGSGAYYPVVNAAPEVSGVELAKRNTITGQLDAYDTSAQMRVNQLRRESDFETANAMRMMESSAASAAVIPGSDTDITDAVNFNPMAGKLAQEKAQAYNRSRLIQPTGDTMAMPARSLMGPEGQVSVADNVAPSRIGQAMQVRDEFQDSLQRAAAKNAAADQMQAAIDADWANRPIADTEQVVSLRGPSIVSDEVLTPGEIVRREQVYADAGAPRRGIALNTASIPEQAPMVRNDVRIVGGPEVESILTRNMEGDPSLKPEPLFRMIQEVDPGARDNQVRRGVQYETYIDDKGNQRISKLINPGTPVGQWRAERIVSSDQPVQRVSIPRVNEAMAKVQAYQGRQQAIAEGYTPRPSTDAYANVSMTGDEVRQIQRRAPNEMANAVATIANAPSGYDDEGWAYMANVNQQRAKQGLSQFRSPGEMEAVFAQQRRNATSTPAQLVFQQL
ncbi:MAG: hypothetical protein AAGA83_00440 [Cyanobacteria bacterium P01_F01_bin.116]